MLDEDVSLWLPLLHWTGTQRTHISRNSFSLFPHNNNLSSTSVADIHVDGYTVGAIAYTALEGCGLGGGVGVFVDGEFVYPAVGVAEVAFLGHGQSGFRRRMVTSGCFVDGSEWKMVGKYISGMMEIYSAKRIAHPIKIKMCYLR